MMWVHKEEVASVTSSSGVRLQMLSINHQQAAQYMTIIAGQEQRGILAPIVERATSPFGLSKALKFRQNPDA